MKNSYNKTMLMTLLMLTMGTTNAIVPTDWDPSKEVDNTSKPLTDEEIKIIEDQIKDDYPIDIISGENTTNKLPSEEELKSDYPIEIASGEDRVNTPPSEEELKPDYPIEIASDKDQILESNYNIFSHTVLTLPDHPMIDEPWSKVITNQKDWESFFYAQTAHISYFEGQAPSPEKLDFENYQILTGGLGLKNSGGYSLIVEGVFELDNEIDLRVLEIKPSENCLTPAVMSYPSATVLIKKTNKPFKLSISKLINECLD